MKKGRALEKLVGHLELVLVGTDKGSVPRNRMLWPERDATVDYAKPNNVVPDDKIPYIIHN